MLEQADSQTDDQRTDRGQKEMNPGASRAQAFEKEPAQRKSEANRMRPSQLTRVGRHGSKIKLVNILFREKKRLAQQDVVPLDLDRTEPSRRQAGGAWLQRTVLECAGGLERQIA